MGFSMSTPSPITINGREFELYRNLTYLELDHIDASLGLYKKLMFTLTGKVLVRKDEPGVLEVWMWRHGKDSRLCHVQGYEKTLRWDG
jgi:hypothetical protein